MICRLFEAVRIDASRHRSTIPALTLLGAPGRDRIADTAGPSVASVDELVDPRFDRWGEQVPSEGILARMVLDATDSTILGQSLAADRSAPDVLPSPLARAALDDFRHLGNDLSLAAYPDESDDPADRVVRLDIGPLLENGTSVISLSVNDDAVGAIA